MYKSFRSTILGTLILGLSACGGIDINKFDGELIDLHKLKQSKAEGALDIAMSASLDARFAQLAAEAFEAGKNLDGGDQLNQLSLYRIAITARWQSLDHDLKRETPEGDKEIPSTLAIAKKGQAACKKKYTDGKRTIAKLLPRDCLLFDLVPHLSDHDTAQAAFRSAQFEYQQKPDEPKVTLAVYRNSYNTLRRSFKEVTDVRNKNLESPVPKSFWRWVDRQRLHTYCALDSAITAYGQISLNDGPEDQCTALLTLALDDGLKTIRTNLNKVYGTDSCSDIETTGGKWKEASLKKESFSLTKITEPDECKGLGR